MPDNNLLLDTNIRNWILIPLVTITLLVQILKYYLIPMGRDYVSKILGMEKKLTLEDIQKGQAVMRSRLLRENGGYVPLEAFNKRKEFLLHGEDGDKNNNYNNNNYNNNKDKKRNKKGNRKFKKKEDPPKKDGIITKGKDLPKPTAPPGIFSDGASNQITRAGMFWIGSYISQVFSGYLILKIPFSITSNFNKLFQSGVQLENLNPSWMSSLSLYMVVMYGSRHFMKYFVETKVQADQYKEAQEKFEGSYNMIKENVRGYFNNEWEQLQIAKHDDLLHEAAKTAMSENPLPKNK